jgi:hypothetical protein
VLPFNLLPENIQRAISMGSLGRSNRPAFVTATPKMQKPAVSGGGTVVVDQTVKPPLPQSVGIEITATVDPGKAVAIVQKAKTIAPKGAEIRLYKRRTEAGTIAWASIVIYTDSTGRRSDSGLHLGRIPSQVMKFRSTRGTIGTPNWRPSVSRSGVPILGQSTHQLVSARPGILAKLGAPAGGDDSGVALGPIIAASREQPSRVAVAHSRALALPRTAVAVTP